MKSDFNRALIICLLSSLILIGTQAFAKEKTFQQIVSDVKAQITEVSVGEIKNSVDTGRNLVILDVRTSDEFDAGHLPGSINIPRGVLEFLVGKSYPNKDVEIVLYCRTDARAALCTKVLMDMGYTNVKNLKGGFKAWGEAGYPIYNRHGEFKMIAFEKKE